MKGDAGLMKEAPLSFAPSVGWLFFVRRLCGLKQSEQTEPSTRLLSRRRIHLMSFVSV